MDSVKRVSCTDGGDVEQRLTTRTAVYRMSCDASRLTVKEQ